MSIQPNILQMQNGHKAFGMRVLFDQATFSLNQGEHVGVIGPNGAGKTTLFKILVGLEQLDEGQMTKAIHARVGYLAQHDEWHENETVEDYLSRGCLMPLWDLKALSKGLGLNAELFAKPIQSLSGGYRMRVKLLHLLGELPDLLLLDEPTNYLDLESLLVLENFLQTYEGAFLLISHDREFLRRTTDHILEVEAGEIIKFSGNLDDYFEQKAMLREQLEKRAQSVEEKRKDILDFVSRFGAKATKAKQAQSRLKSLDRLEKVEIKELPRTAKIQIPQPIHTGKEILRLDSVDLGYGEKIVLKNIQFQIMRGDHLGVVGVNGAGKSTFLKAISGQLLPLKGEVKLGQQVEIGYYAQHVSEGLTLSNTVHQELLRLAHPSVLPQEVLNVAGSLLFSGADLEKKVDRLSGGERSRVALGQILLQRRPCLVLDEPTNHLDFQTVEALTAALADYEGTVITVSHDRSFISSVARKILEIKNGEALYYPGTYDEYVWSQQQGALQDIKLKETNSFTPSSTEGKDATSEEPKFNYKEQKKVFEKEYRRLDKRLKEVDELLPKLQNKIEDANTRLIATQEKQEMLQLTNELSSTQDQVNKLEEEWLVLETLKEEVQRKMNDL